MARPKNIIETVPAVFKITPEQDKNINLIVANQYEGGNKEEDRSHLVRLAIEFYINEFYKDKI